jgi:hypothetical protein
MKMKNMKLKITTLIIALFASLTLAGQSTENVTNYLATSNKMVFDSTSFQLVKSYHPQENYYKQEYLAQGVTLERF